MNIKLWKKIYNMAETRYLDRYGSGRAFTEKLVSSLGPGDILLDLGCGEGKLQKIITSKVKYIGLDRYIGKQNNEYDNWEMRPNILGDIHQLPLSSDSIKTVALMHVLEHAYSPTKVFAEIYRVLQPGGSLFVDVPFMHEVHHAPHDYYRYTQYSLAYMAKSMGFQVEEIRPSGGYFRALAHMLEEAPKISYGEGAGGYFVRLILGYPLKGLGWIIRKLQYLLDILDNTQYFTCGYHCIYRKPPHETRR